MRLDHVRTKRQARAHAPIGWIIAATFLSAGGPAKAAPLAATPSVAAPAVVSDGIPYSSWTEYFGSAHFQSAGKRCGTVAPEGISDLQSPPSDCSYGLTNPAEEYAPGEVWEIPVVVHIIQSVTGQGAISDELVHSQIEVLNEDFRALPGLPGEGGTDVTVQFRLATVDPDGNATSGITRNTDEVWFLDQGNYWDELAWDPNRYCNIYTNTAGGGGVILGYVPFLPQEGGAGSAEDRIVILWSAFGRPGQGGAPYDQGRTATHEMGHYLGLFHTFQDGCGVTDPPGCHSSGDRICDTEPEEASQGGCPEGATSCGTLDPIHNYMDYTDDLCMNQFTEEQSRRIRCTLQHYRPELFETTPTAVAEDLPGGARIWLASHPNPIRSGATIEYFAPAAGRASLQIMDVAGRRVRGLMDGELVGGRHEIQWDGRNDAGTPVESGIYFYRLRASDGEETERVVLIR